MNLLKTNCKLLKHLVGVTPEPEALENYHESVYVSYDDI